MGHPSVLGVLTLLLAVQLSTCENPFVPVSDTCSVQRCEEPTKFKYTAGEAYRYKYSANTASTVLGVTRKSTNLTLHCDVIVHVITPCEHAITIENVQLHTVAEDQGSATEKTIESDSFSSPLESFHLRYGFHDGIVDAICPQNGDPTWSVNVKRGIVSALQNSMDRIDLDYNDVERDVTGDCPVSYSVEGIEGAALVITKTRDLNSCVGRFAHTSHIQGVGYSIKSPVQNIPVVSSTSSCRQTILTNRLTSVICEERHLLKPFSHDESGAVTFTSQNLTLVQEDSTSADVSQYVIKNRDNLLYNHLPAKSASHTRETSLADARALVEELCEDDSEVRVESTTQFSQLIDDLRGMTDSDIRALHQLSPRICRHGQQLIEDALPVVSTAGSLRLMTDLIVEGEVSDRVANTWLLALNFIPSVDQAMLQIAAGLLQVQNPAVETRTRLAVGAVIHQYCRQHEKCETDHVALEIMDQLARPLGADCRSDNQEDEIKVLLTLRAAGNAGLSPPSVVNTLNECFMSRDNPARVKVAAIEAYRRFSCAVRRDEMRSVFRDMAEDSEVRIAAYLGLMRCPSHQEVGMVRAALELEQVNQVGSFVWTHLMNLQETASPYQLEVQGLLADLHLQTKFNTDARKFSRNFEISGFNSEFHVGASVDSNLVYSSKSYIPRSLNSNLTLQMFGESVNLLEVGARLEGMERMVESVFAPGGVLHNAAPGPLFRSRRETEQGDKLEKIKADFDAAGRIGDPQAFFHMKVFGHEVDGVDLRSSDGDRVSQWLTKNGPGEWSKWLSNTESLDISRSVKFLEGTYIVPTGVGLPLNLTVSAVAAVNVQMSGNAQLDRLLFNQELDLAFRLRPSGAVTCDMTMMVDGMAVQLGMGMKATVHSSTLLDASLKMEGFKLVDAQISMPKDRMDVYNFESSMQFIHQDKQTTLTSEITMEGDKHKQVSFDACSGGEKIKGWRTCAQLQYVNASDNELSPHFPLTGPTKIALYVEKTDKTMEGYKLVWSVTENQFEHNLAVTFDTPRSTIDRKVELKLKRSKKHGRIGFKFTYPGEKLTGNGETAWEPRRKKLALEVSRRGVEVLSLTAQLVTDQTASGVMYRPAFILNLAQNPYANLQGFVKLSKVGEAKEREISLSLTSPYISLSLNSNATDSPELYKSDILIRHSIQGSQERELSLLLEARDADDGDGGRVGHWMVATDWDLADRIRFAWASRWDSKNSLASTMNKIQTAARPQDFDESPTFSAGYAFDYMSTEESSKVRGSVHLKYPSARLDLMLTGEHDSIYRGLMNKITLRYATGRELRSRLNLTGLPLRRTGKLEGSWELEVPDYPHPIQLTGAVRGVAREDATAPNEYKYRLEGHWLNGGSVLATGQYQLQTDQPAMSFNHRLGLDLSVDGRPLANGSLRLGVSPAGVTVNTLVNYNSSEYGVEMQYQETAVESDIQRSVRLGLTYPGSGYSVTGTLRLGEMFRTTVELSLDGQRDVHLIVGGSHTDSLLAGVVDVKWDANRDPTQRLMLDFRSEEPSDSTHNITMRMVYPVNTVELTMDRTMTGGWSRLQYHNHLVLAFGAAEPVEMTVSASTALDVPTKRVSVDATITSPFPHWTSNSLKLSHARSVTGLQSRLEVLAGGEQFVVSVDGDTQLPRSLTLSGHITSSLERWRRLEARLNHQLQREGITSSIVLETPENRISGDLALLDMSSGDEMRYRAELNVTTPFQGVHDASYVLDGRRSAGVFLLTGESRMENIGHNLLLKGQGGSRIEGSLVLDQVHPQLNMLTAQFLLDPTDQGRAFKTSVKWPHNRAALEGDMHFASWADFGVGLQFISPLEAIKDVGMMVKHSQTGAASFQSEARVAWLGENPLGLMVEFDFKPATLEPSEVGLTLKSELRLPLPRWSRVTLGLKGVLDQNSRTMSAGIDGALDEYKVALTADGSLGSTSSPFDKRYGTVSLTLPAGPVRQLTVAASLLPSADSTYEVFFSPVWRLEDGSMQQIRLTSVVELNKADVRGALHANLRLLTPWTEMLFTDLQHTPSGDEFITRLVGSMGRHSAQLKSQLMLPSSGAKKFLLSSTSNVPGIPAFESTTTFSTHPTFYVTVSVLTPDEYILRVAADLTSPQRKTAAFEMRTPLEGLDRVAANLEVAGDGRSWSEAAVAATITLPGYQQPIALSGTYRPPFDLRLTFSTPFEGFSKGSLQLSADVGGDAPTSELILRLTWDTYKLELMGTTTSGQRGVPEQVMGTLTVNLPVGPRVSGQFQLVARQDEDIIYDLAVTSSVDKANYALKGEIFTGPRQYGVVIETNSSEQAAQLSAKGLVILNTGGVQVRLGLNAPHKLLQNVSLTAEYRDSKTEGHKLSYKLRLPTMQLEASSRVFVRYWPLFHVGVNGKLTMGSMILQRSARVFHERAAGGGSELGVAWELASASWGRYAVLADYLLSDAGFDGKLLAGKDVDSDSKAATDLQLGADVDWQARAAMGRAVLTAHIRDTSYSLDTDYSGPDVHAASMKFVRRMPGSELEVTARGHLAKDANSGRHVASLNFTMPVDGYKGVNTAWEVKHMPQIFEFRSTIEIDPKSSFYQNTQHQFELNYDGSPQSPHTATGDFKYLHHDLDDDLDITKVNGNVNLINNRNQMGVSAKGELNDGRYTLELLQASNPLGKTGKLNITSTFEALEDFLSEYEISSDPADPNALKTTFGAIFNKKQLVDGTYQFMQSESGSQRYTLELQNPLHPFKADLTHMNSGDQRRVDFTIISQLEGSATISGSVQRSITDSGRTLDANLTLPGRQLGVRHSVERRGPVYQRSARLSLSPEAFVGYQLTVTSGTEKRQEEGGSVKLQLDFPARSLAGAVEAARTLSRRNDAFSSGRAKLQFQWDAERQPERQVAATFNVADLSTTDNMHYNLSINVDLAGKPVTLDTSVQRSSTTPLQLDAAFMYSADRDSHLTMSYGVVDQSRGSKQVFKSTLFVSHPVSRLSVTGKGLLEVARGTVKISGSYTYLDIEDRTLESTVLLQVDRKLGEFKALISLPSIIYELKSTVGLKEYRVNGKAMPTEFGSPQTLLATMDRQRPLVKLEILYDPEQAKRLYVTGGMVNNRTVQMEAYRQAGQYRVDDVVFFLRLNHSHLLTSQARWRTELGYELTEWARLSALSARDALLDASSAEWEVKTGAMESSLEAMFGQEIDMLVEEFTSESSGTVRGDFEDMRYAVSESYNNNGFYMKTIVSYVYGDDDSLVNSLLNQLGSWIEELREDLGVINEAVYVQLNKFIEFLRNLVSSSGNGERSVTDTLKEVLAEMAEAYNQWAKSVYARTSLRLRQVYTTATGYVRHRLMQLGQQYKPQMLILYHHFETHVVQVVRDTVNWFYGEFTQSELYSAFVSLESVIDQLYRDISERDTVTNVFDYTKKIARWLYTKFGLVDVLGEPGLWLKDAWDNPPPMLVKMKAFLMVAYEKVSPVLEHLAEVAQHLFAKIYRDGDKFWTQTAIEGAQRYFEGKSIMDMNIDQGYISFVQILPMPWYGLNQSPIWEELPELQQLRYLQSFMEGDSSKSGGFYDFIFDYWPGSDPMDWMPPFKGHAVLSGSSTFVTFDGRLYTFRSDCTYLLAGDLLNDRFSVEATFKRRGPASKTIAVSAGGHTIELGGPDGYRITVDGQPGDAPLEVGELQAVRSGDVVTVSLPGWVELKCNQRSDVCALEISRWMFGRTGGLFGTLDNEPYTDLQTPDHLSASGRLFAAGWALKGCRRPADVRQLGQQGSDSVSVRTAGKRADGFCRGLLESPQSEYRVCHRLVNPQPFLAACEAQQDEQRCVAVRAYVETCQQRGWPLKMPNKCVQCKIGGKAVSEGRTVKLQMEKPATEVVFIIEAKQCNANATHRRSLSHMVRSLHTILRKEGFATTRFAVLAFGGSGVQDKPQVITVDGHIFNPAKKASQAFDQIKPGSGSRDVFGALRRAAMLPFTPGVSRTFILLPCSACEASEMSVDYTTLANAFAEQQITLHVILDGDLKVSKQRNRLLGIDSKKAYTMKDAKRFVGDEALLKHVKSTKAELSLCEPLATKQTNGAIFSSSKLSPHPKKGKINARHRKRLLAVFGRRVAQTARPEPCQSCECATDVEGTVRPLCMPCTSDLLLPLDPEDDIFFEVEDA